MSWLSLRNIFIMLVLLSALICFAVLAHAQFFSSRGLLGGFESGVVVSGGSGPASGDGLLLENGMDFLILETGDFLLLE